MSQARPQYGAAPTNEGMGRPWESGVVPVGGGERATPVPSRGLHQTIDLIASFRLDASALETLLERDGHAIAVLRSMVDTIGRIEHLVQETLSHTVLAEAASRSPSELIAASLAHEINNPLAALMAHLDSMSSAITHLAVPEASRCAPLDELQGSLEESREAAEQIRRVVREMNGLPRADGEQRVPLSIHRLLDSAARMARHQIHRRARLVKDYGDAPLVSGNETRVGQVLLNLLVNAAQAIEEGRPDENEIRIVTRTGPSDQLVVEIHDTGSGIPPENLERILEPFFTTKPPGQGTGLGLPICRQIISSMGGRIGVESVLGAGSVVRIELPALRDDRAEFGP
jgi:signal transduction histidine kinase